MEQTTEKFESYALIEVMGHTKIAGKARTVTFGSTVMLQIDVPETSKQPAFSKLLGMNSIFSITPVTEELALMHAEAYNVHPITEYSLRLAIDKKVDKEVEERISERLMLEQGQTTVTSLGPEYFPNGDEDQNAKYREYFQNKHNEDEYPES